jgi:predicted nucleic-acid-binding protein
MKYLGVDTNVLLRLIVNDDPSQRQLALKFGEGLNREYKGFVTLVSVIEIDWALRSQYGYSKTHVIQALKSLLRIAGLNFQSPDVILSALDTFEQKKTDFADAIIAAQSLEEGCETILTFDRNAAKSVPGMELLA